MESNADATILGDDNSSNAETIAPAAVTPRKTPSQRPATQHTPRTPSGAGFLTSSDPIGGGRFTPGLIIAERYRIVALLGRGGMGEVYRAEDLKLSQVVAIKFLPETLSKDPGALQRFHAEVRIARQVSHPNICRVFDIGDADGIPFLTMEFVAGEDLASLIRRIGRLSPDKATEIARQICAGLAAAHERGVIHRDLKPANVMLDEAGKVRVTDFGLAAIAASISGAEARAGTPAYMAPEQLAGKEVTPKSDIYSLGLVLYEILTGKRAFEAATLPELIKAREAGLLTSPSTLVRDLDPLLDRVILRCLEKDPAQRPASALQVAAALPGGDPMAAALAAGETPSPEMVAAAGETEGLNPKVAALCLVGVVISLLALFAISKRTKMISMLPLSDSPEVLASKAHDMIVRFGYTAPVADSAFLFNLNDSYLRYLRDSQKNLSRWDALRNDEPPSLYFYYRESPRFLTSFVPVDNLVYGRVAVDEPSINVSGMTVVGLSPNGRLLYFEAVPPQVDDAKGPAPAPNWTPMLEAAGLDPAKLKSVDSKWLPLEWGDTRAAWEGTWPQRPDIPLRVEAAAYRGKPIYFDLLSPWNKPVHMVQTAGTQNRIGQIFSFVITTVIILGGVWIASRNIRLQRGDFPGALRLAIFVFAVGMANWALLAHHNGSPAEYVIAILAISVSLFFSGITWLLYVALEPYIRRYWPNTIISWVRMLKGQFRDPVLGRDILIGAFVGVAIGALEHLQPIVEAAFGKVPSQPTGFTLFALEGIRGSLASTLYSATQSLSSALLIFFIFFLVRLIVRKTWLAAVLVTLIFAVPALGAEHVVIELLFSLPVIALFLVVLYRFGLLALAAFFFAERMADNMPITLPLSAWYAEGGIVAAVAILLVAIYGFQIARAGKPLFGAGALDA
jgi:serine/threonine-protein kinase